MQILKRSRVKRIIIILSIAANVFLFLLLFANWADLRPVFVAKLKTYPGLFSMARTVVYFFRAEKIDAEEQEAITQNIDQLMTVIHERVQELSSDTERIDYVRNFVYTNSIHKGGAEYAWDTAKVLSRMAEFYETQESPPHLTCGSRTYTMKSILDKLEIDNRIIMIFGDNASRVASHTFLEAFNRDSNRWEIHDADLNVFYQDVNTLSRASTAQLVLNEVEDFEPCSSSACGWEAHDLWRLVEHRRFGAVLYDNRKHLELVAFNRKPVYKSSVIIMNTDRFSVTKRFPDDEDMTFIEFANAHYGDPVFIFNQQFE